MNTWWAAQEYSQQSSGSFNPGACKQFACQTVLHSSDRLICPTRSSCLFWRRRRRRSKPRYFGFFSSASGLDVAAMGFVAEIQGGGAPCCVSSGTDLQTQLNRGQPRVRNGRFIQTSAVSKQRPGRDMNTKQPDPMCLFFLYFTFFFFFTFWLCETPAFDSRFSAQIFFLVPLPEICSSVQKKHWWPLTQMMFVRTLGVQR